MMLLLQISVQIGQAQTALDDIYNWREQKSAEPGAAKPWPPFYNPPQMSAAHQLKYAMGWCRVRSAENFRNTPAYTVNAADFVIVSKLPDASFVGTIISNSEGALLVKNETVSQMAVLINADAEISRVAVSGEALPPVIKTGMYVRFSGIVNDRGDASNVANFEVFTPPKDFQLPTVSANQMQTIFARVAGHLGSELRLRVKNDKLPRVTLKLADDLHIGLHTTDYALAVAGDEITVKGKLFRPADSTDSGIFASDVQIKLSAPTAGTTKKRKSRGQDSGVGGQGTKTAALSGERATEAAR